MGNNGTNDGFDEEVLNVRTRRIIPAILAALSLLGVVWTAQAGPPLQQCTIQPSAMPAAERQRSSRPECGLELTCTDKPVLLGYPQGVCFRATCPGIWGVIHRRADQSSFRRRFISYRHFTFRGYWELKDRGTLAAGPVPLRELFLVLPDDLIEFKLTDPDCHARVEIRKLGYIKTGSLCELQKWLAYHSYLEKAGLNAERTAADGGVRSNRSTGPGCLDPVYASTIGRVFSLGRAIGLPLGEGW